MPSAAATVHIPAPAEQVWQLIGGFDSLPDWLPFIARSELSERGRVRTLHTDDGAVIVERLQHYDNAARTPSYSIDQGPFPASDYLATVRVEADGQGTQVTWSGHFQGVGVSDEEISAMFQGVYEGGLAALRANYPT